MDLQNMQNQDMNLVLTTDAKPRLKWTAELHQRFVEAVNQLGGADKATPKSLMRMMGIPGLTLYHLKSHLQKYRLGKNQQHSEACSESKRDDSDYKVGSSLNSLDLLSDENGIDDKTQEEMNENIQIARAIHIQMDVRRKLHEQIKVQRHLQLRIEAQGKYLQKVLKKAQETLLSYNCSAAGVELAKAELSQLVSMVSTSSFSGLTETTDLPLEKLDRNHTMRHTGYSVESSLTSLDRREEEEEGTQKGDQETSPLMLNPLLDQSKSRGSEPRKRSRRSTTCDANCVEQRGSKRSKQAYREEMGLGLKKFGVLETFDLNSQCEYDLDLGTMEPIDLNSQE